MRLDINQGWSIGMTCMTGKPERSFVDTNILIYAFDRTAGLKQETAKKLLIMLQTVRTGFISIQVMQEFHVIVTQKIQQPLKIEDSVDILRDLSKWYMHIPNSDDVLAAINIQKEYQLSFWDAMIVQSALHISLLKRMMTPCG